MAMRVLLRRDGGDPTLDLPTVKVNPQLGLGAVGYAFTDGAADPTNVPQEANPPARVEERLAGRSPPGGRRGRPREGRPATREDVGGGRLGRLARGSL